jgi:hypothetical protein
MAVQLASGRGLKRWTTALKPRSSPDAHLLDLGAPGSPQRTWDNHDWFPMLSQKGATANVPSVAQSRRGAIWTVPSLFGNHYCSLTKSATG